MLRVRSARAEEIVLARQSAQEQYQRDLLKAGEAPDEATAAAYAQQEITNLLRPPFGSAEGASEREALQCMVLSDPARSVDVGTLWFGSNHANLRGTLDYLAVHPAEQRRGYARQALHWLHEVMVRAGMRLVVLHVFKHNVAACSLYQEAGYKITRAVMQHAATSPTRLRMCKMVAGSQT